MPIDEGLAGLTLSLMDRLIDREPGAIKEVPSNSWDLMREFKIALCRDLTALLNTRRATEDFDPAFAEATNSLLTFGITDFMAYNLNSEAEQEQIRRSISRAIRQFEPRLTQVEISVGKPDPLRPVLRFQISAVLRIEPTAEPVVFDATLQRESRRIAVSGGDA